MVPNIANSLVFSVLLLAPLVLLAQTIILALVLVSSPTPHIAYCSKPHLVQATGRRTGTKTSGRSLLALGDGAPYTATLGCSGIAYSSDLK